MGKLFNHMTTVVHQTPSIPDEQLAIKKRQWLLLPTIAYKILVPIEREQSLNFFQQTILRLFLSGNKKAGYIAEKLLLKEELVQYIINELTEQEYLEKGEVVTQKGKDVLSELETPYELKTGYIFFDLLTRTYWDQFVLADDLHFASAEFERNGMRKIEMGRLDAPKKRTALVLPPVDEQMVQPSAVDALTVLNRYRTRLKSLQQGYLYGEQGNETFLKGIEKVQFLEEPIPVYVTTFIYMSADVLNKSQWEVCHPFGGGPSAKLRDHINDMRDHNQLLLSHITDLVSDTLRTSDIEREENMSREDQGALHYLKDLFGHKLLAYPTVISHGQQLYKKFVDLQKLMQQENRGSHFDDIQSKLSTFFIQSAEIIEETLYIMRHLEKVKDQKRVQGYPSILSKHRFKNADLLADIAAGHLKFNGYHDEEENVFKRFLAVSMGEVKYIEQSKKLQPLVAYHLLSAREQYDHPFHQMATSFPIFIPFLDRLVHKRNEFAHTTDVTYYIETTDKVFFYTLKILSILLDLEFHEDVLMSQVNYEQDELIIDKKERLLCEQNVDLNISSTIRTHASLFKSLTDMHYFRKTRNHHFAIKATSVLEELFNLLLDRVSLNGAEKWIKRDGRHTLHVMKPILRKYGFVLKPESLPQSFTRVNTQKLKLDVQLLKGSVLSRKVYAFLAAMCVQKDPSWAELAKLYPHLIPFIAGISDKRKHGHVVLEDEEMVQMEEQIFEFVRVIEPFIKLEKAV